MPFAQLIIGPPGSGKTTFCHGVQQFLRATGRKLVMINMDPANENITYECDVDVRDLLSLNDAMEEFGLGPNGGLLHCMENLEQNLSWLESKLKSFPEDSYFVFDFPGQVELFTNHPSIKNIIHKLERTFHFRFVVVHLADSTSCRDSLRYISLSLLTLQSMLMLECPQINIMSKFDLFDSGDAQEINFPLSYYTECQNLQYLLDRIDNTRFGRKMSGLNAAVCDLIEDFGLVSFIPCAVEDKECMAFIIQEIDKASGFVFGGLTAGNESILQTAMTTVNLEEYLESMERKYFKSSKREIIED